VNRPDGRVSIRTPDQRVRVFVSSTLEELSEERQAVRQAIESLRMTPVMFEQGARPHPPRALYRAYLDQSDVFVGLYWESYGWVAPGEEMSGLEDEYVLCGDRPRLIYLKTPAPNREPRLSRMIERIQRDDRASYRHFSDPDELRSLVADDLAVLLSEHFSSKIPPRFGLPSLPRPPTPLIGRDEDIAGVLRLLSEPTTRLVTIFGTGGIGKSRLALAVAEQAEDRYADGVAYVDLAPVGESSLLLLSVATALGIQERPGGSLAAQLRERLSGTRMLIVLDNVEQLADATADLSEVLASSDTIQFLTTSRRMLDVRGERLYELEPLAVPTGADQYTAAVELFLDRARAIQPEFQPAGDELATIGEICRRLDGLPLAIELASARARTLSPQAILERMGHHRLDFLRTGPRDLPARQRTLRDTIAWSHSLLSPNAQLLFARLAVFVGGAELEAIEQITNADGSLDTLDVLAEVVDGSLVRATGDGVQPRFGMLETIREFAVERLEARGDAGDYLARHQTYYLELAERGSAALSTSGQLEWLRRLGRENDNFRAILRRAVRRDDSATALRMGLALSTYWQIHADYGEARGRMEQIAALPSASPHDRAVAWTIGAIQAFLLGDREQLKSGLDDAIRLATDEDQRTVAFARLLRAIGNGVAPKDPELTEATHLLEAQGEPLAIAVGLVATASLARGYGQVKDAQRLAQAGHDLSAQIGEWWVRTYASGQLSVAALELGDRMAARRHAVESLDAAQRIGNLSAAGDALGLWAMADLRDGRAEQAGRLFALGERAYERLGHGQWRPDATSYRRFSSELQAALGDRYEQLLEEARDVNLDDAMSKLIGSGGSSDDSPPDNASRSSSRRSLKSTSRTAAGSGPPEPLSPHVPDGTIAR
jgi:predicted ATPase